MKLSVSNRNPAMSAVSDLENYVKLILPILYWYHYTNFTYPALFASVFASPLRSPAYSGAKSFGLLFTAIA